MARVAFKDIGDPSAFFNTADPYPYVNFSFSGKAGAGKSYTAFEVAKGLWKLGAYKRGIVVVDTENSFKWMKKDLYKLGFFLFSNQARQDHPDGPFIYLLSTDPDTGTAPGFADVCKAMDFMNNGGPEIMIIDSLTKIHRGYVEAYRQKHCNRGGKIRKPTIGDWPVIKDGWRDNFTDRVINGRGSVIWTDRIANTFEEIVDDRSGKKDIVKTGEKQAGDAEIAYEADFNIEMVLNEVQGAADRSGKRGQKRVYRTATILKSRDSRLDGQVLNFDGKKKGPSFKEFESAIKLVIGDDVGTQDKQLEGRAKDGDLFDAASSPADEVYENNIRSSVQGILYELVPSGTKGRSTQIKKEIVAAFGEGKHWKSLEKMSADELSQGLDKLKLRRGELFPERLQTFDK